MSAAPDDSDLRNALLATVRRLDVLGLNRGTTGNASVRGGAGGGFWITPTGIEVADLGAGDLVWIADDGTVAGVWEPSSEWPFHAAIHRSRADLNAVIHVHSVHATALACLRRPLPAFHYMVAVAGGDSVPCTPYHLFGSAELSRAVAAAFADRHACLLANHGLVAGGRDLAHALKVTCEIEALCESYLAACAAGTPVLLDAAQMAAVAERFSRYGRSRRKG